MRPSVNAFLAAIWSSFRTRAELEMEILALRHQLAVLQQAVQNQAQATVELHPLDAVAEQEIAHHEMGHLNQRGGRGRERGQAFECRVAFAAEAQDLVVEVLLAREMPE